MIRQAPVSTDLTLSVLNVALLLNSGAATVTFLAIFGLAFGAAYIAMGSPKLSHVARRRYNSPTSTVRRR
jgi:acetyl-CoA carboxylase carboxyltransferase component